MSVIVRFHSILLSSQVLLGCFLGNSAHLLALLDNKAVFYVSVNFEIFQNNPDLHITTANSVT